jgi:hypothetical protein
MMRIIVNGFCLGAAFYIFYLLTLILAKDLPLPEWMPFDFHDGPWLAATLKLFGVLLVGSPLISFLLAVFEVGGEQARWKLYQGANDDLLTLRLPVGLRVGMTLLGLLLMTSVVFMLWYGQEPWAAWIFAAPVLVLCLYAMILFVTIRVEFNQDYIIAMTPALRWQKHEWRNFRQMRFHNEWQELRLQFDDGRIARVSLMFNHLPDFIEFVKDKAKEIDQDLATED